MSTTNMSGEDQVTSEQTEQTQLPAPLVPEKAAVPMSTEAPKVVTSTAIPMSTEEALKVITSTAVPMSTEAPRVFTSTDVELLSGLPKPVDGQLKPVDTAEATTKLTEAAESTTEIKVAAEVQKPEVQTNTGEQKAPEQLSNPVEVKAPKEVSHSEEKKAPEQVAYTGEQKAPEQTSGSKTPEITAAAKKPAPANTAKKAPQKMGEDGQFDHKPKDAGRTESPMGSPCPGRQVQVHPYWNDPKSSKNSANNYKAPNPCPAAPEDPKKKK